MDLMPRLSPPYGEMAFDGDHSAHCAAWLEERRLQRIIQRDLAFLMSAQTRQAGQRSAS